MNKRLDYFLEISQFPLIILFTGCVLIGLGNLIVNPYIEHLWNTNGQLINLISLYLKLIGNYIIVFFPLLFVSFALAKKFDDTYAGILGTVSYFIILIATMIFGSQKMNSIAYSSIFGLSISSSDFPILSSTTQIPYALGLVATFICYQIVKHYFAKTRNKRNFGILSFIDKNSYCLLCVIFSSMIIGYIVSILWPYVIRYLFVLFDFIADDITNPFNLFLYGIIENLFGTLNLADIPHQIFWFSEYGGSWLDSFGRKYVGDVAIWTAQSTSTAVNEGIGRFITPLYVIQIFALPGYILALYTLYTNRFEKRRYFLLMILLIVACIFMGNSAPFDLFILATTPLLFFIHVFASGVIYALLQWMKLYIGYSYAGQLSLATPGSLLNLFIYFKSSAMFDRIRTLCIVGIIIFLIYFLGTRAYYKYLAYDMFQSGIQKELVDLLISSLGGIENIKVMDSNPFKILVQVHDETKVDVGKLRSLCNGKVFESKTGYVLYFYKASSTIHNDVELQINEYKKMVG